MIIAPYVSVLINQYHKIGMYKSGVYCTTIHSKHFHMLDREVINFFFWTCKQPPGCRIYLKAIRPFFQCGYTVTLRIHRKRQELNKLRCAVASPFRVCYAILKALHIARELRTDRWAMGKKEI